MESSWNGFNGVVRLSLGSRFVSRCVSGLLEFLIVVPVAHACASASSVVVVVLLVSLTSAPVAIGGKQLVRAEERKAQGGKNRQDQD